MNRSWIVKRIVFILIVYLASFYFYDQHVTTNIDLVDKMVRTQTRTKNNTKDASENNAPLLLKTTTQSEIPASIKTTQLPSVQVSCSPLIENTVQETFRFDNVAYPRYFPQSLNKSLNFTCMNKNTQPKLFMFWNKLDGKDDFHFGIGKDRFKRLGCPATNCETTNDRSRINESSLVLFSLWDKIDKLPKWRKPEQRWVFILSESIQRYFVKQFTNYDGVFNISVSSSVNSDTINNYISYWNVKWELNNDFDVNQNFMENRTGMAFQVTSNCKPPSGRHIYIAELKKHIQVDIYGECGKPCPNVDDKWLTAECLLTLLPQYKFYLSFENTICEEYITEKFFRLINYNIIPVVYGGGPYDKYIPKSGYINPFDFESPRHLAEYMTKVASNETLYNSYFKWKQYIKRIKKPIVNPLCELCIKLNLEHYFGVQHSVIRDMNAYLNKTKECKSLNTVTFKLQPL